MKRYLFSTQFAQSFFEKLLRMALRGLNYDKGQYPDRSGEDYVLKQLRKKNPQKELTIFDVGANKGQYSEMVKNALNGPYWVYAFEPQNFAFNILKKQEEEGRMTAFNFGFGDKVERKHIYFDTKGSVWGSVFPAHYENYEVQLCESEEIQLKTVDSFCLENGISEIDLLKIDVEGFEIEVLKGCAELLKSHKIQHVQFEFGLAAIEARVFLKDFFSILKDYDIYRVLPFGFRKIHYSEWSELFLTTNYLAVLR
ncbi:FkbM family methyltransferase [Xanthovirga aplysinae]|uniref:FkbM family methyltransferase n=1 Tax=Xanthovirga aplysinae TaxID=2529853 RepID=UPI0012BCC427|nr:FkbM family methyltransferase [Xanthovirga aplysinae]MTI30650.1 FkbM family methyltransferase [Xanthovirga aplysinae]